MSQAPRMRLGVYADLVYRRDGDTISTDRAFVLFVAALADRVDELVLFGRLHPEPGRAPYALPPNVRLVPFPHYPRVTDLGAVLSSLRGTRRAFAAELRRLDAVWIFGPYPVSLLLALEALRLRRARVFLGVRQDIVAYVDNRLHGWRWAWTRPAARLFDGIWILLARRAPVVVVGEDLARRYRRGGGTVLAAGFSLIRQDDVVDAAEALARSWDGSELRVLSVGRLDPEKNPLLLPEILARLLRDDARWRLIVVGDGSLRAQLLQRADELGVTHALELAGYVANGVDLWQLYRRANAFLHVSFTEGLPQVLFEAHAAGTPVVGTDVGGVSAALRGGATGMLVPPDDAEAAALALGRLRDEPELRGALVRTALQHVASQTTEKQLAPIEALFRSSR
jgi:glycosyltransferase involved in cell wall biosynthesis